MNCIEEQFIFKNLPKDIKLKIYNEIIDKQNHKNLLMRCLPLIENYYLTFKQIKNLINKYVLFAGFHRKNKIINDELHQNITDWNSINFVKPYINKKCRIIGIDDENYNSLECEFEQCDMNGNITNNEEVIELSLVFSENSNGIINYNPIFKYII